MENCVIITSRCPAETAWGRPADEKAYSGMDGSSVRRCSLLPSCAQTLFENEISQNTKRGGRTRGRLFCWLEYSNRGGIEPQGRTISPEHGRAGRYSAVRRRRRPCRVFAWILPVKVPRPFHRHGWFLGISGKNAEISPPAGNLPALSDSCPCNGW